MSSTQRQKSEFYKFKHGLRNASLKELEEMATEYSSFASSRRLTRDALSRDINKATRKLKAIKLAYLEKTGQLPVREYCANGFVRYRLQSLAYNKCILSPEYQWFVLSRRYRSAHRFEIVVSLPRATSAVKLRYGDCIRVIERKKVGCTSVPIALILLNQGARFVHVESWFNKGRGATRTIATVARNIWVGRVEDGEAEATT